MPDDHENDPGPDAFFDPEGPGEHDAHLLDHDTGENDWVACPQCGAEVLAFAQWCPRCGKAFKSEAWKEPGSPVGPMAGAIALVLIIALLAAWLLGGMVF